MIYFLFIEDAAGGDILKGPQVIIFTSTYFSAKLKLQKRSFLTTHTLSQFQKIINVNIKYILHLMHEFIITMKAV